MSYQTNHGFAHHSSPKHLGAAHFGAIHVVALYSLSLRFMLSNHYRKSMTGRESFTTNVGAERMHLCQDSIVEELNGSDILQDFQ